MKLHPRGKWISGRIVDVDKSLSMTLQLPQGQKREVTVLLLVDEVGSDVQRTEVGGIVLYLKSQHCLLRNNAHTMLAHEDDILADFECTEAERSMLTIEPPTFETSVVQEPSLRIVRP